jgi:RNA-directed DNA polymerase
MWILNIDIKDFYPSITFPRVRGLFLSEYFKLSPRVATILARISTTPNGLPQGARTSPIIANLIAANLDKKLLNIATSAKLKYTRYADDITFSSSRGQVSPAVVQSWEPAFGQRKVHLARDLVEAFRSSGFTINDEKTRLLMSYERQEVTGLIVNKGVNVWRKDVARLRMILYSARKHGADSAAKVWVKDDATADQFWSFVCGWLSFIAQIKGKDDPVVAKLCKMAVLSGLKSPEWIVRSADMVREYDVFLSHATEDKPKIRLLKERLELRGVTVFFDEDSIKWGDSITEKINRGLLKSNFFIPFLSNVFSKKGWTNKELNSAIAMNVMRKGRILPIKDVDFSIAENYPLLNETVYKIWPAEAEEAAFVEDVADEILALVEAEKKTDHGLG